MSPQPLLDRNGWYPVGLDFPYLSPNVLSAIVNYKRNRFTITPAMTFNEGQPYGNPADVLGIDPRTCTRNSSKIPSAPRFTQADYTTCGLSATQNGTAPGEFFIPNPQTGVFDSFGAFRQPSQFNLSLQMGYQITPRLKANVLLANLLNACFGGSTNPGRNSIRRTPIRAATSRTTTTFRTFTTGLHPTTRTQTASRSIRLSQTPTSRRTPTPTRWYYRIPLTRTSR